MPSHTEYEQPQLEGLIVDNSHRSRPVEMLIELREVLAGLPKTKRTITLTNYMDWSRGILGHESSQLVAEMCGLWRIPERFNQSKYPTWVRPLDSMRKYADVATRCACGARLVHPVEANESITIDGQQVHGEECRPQDRSRARARIYENRLQITRRGYSLGLRMEDIAPRLAMNRQSAKNSIERMNVLLRDLQVQYRERRAMVFAELLKCYPRSTVATAFECSKRTVSREVRERTSMTPSELYSHRAQNTFENGAHYSSTSCE